MLKSSAGPCLAGLSRACNCNGLDICCCTIKCFSYPQVDIAAKRSDRRQPQTCARPVSTVASMPTHLLQDWVMMQTSALKVCPTLCIVIEENNVCQEFLKFLEERIQIMPITLLLSVSCFHYVAIAIWMFCFSFGSFRNAL